MASVQELSDKVAEARQAVLDAIARLEAQGGGISPADLDPVVSDLQAIIDAANAAGQ